MNRYLLEFVFSSLFINKSKNFFIFFILSLLIFLVSSMFFITSSLQNQQNSLISSMPDIVVQKVVANKQKDISLDVMYKILDIKGVSGVVPRIWGFYYFDKKDVYFSIIGIDKFDYKYITDLKKIADLKEFDSLEDSMIVGSGVYKVLKESFYDKYLNFMLSDSKLKKVKIAGVFKSDTKFLSNDAIILKPNLAREILGIKEGYVSDFILKVVNKDEIPTIAAKIKLNFPNLRVITKEQIKAKYKKVFDFKSGVFLALFVIVLFTFFIIESFAFSCCRNNKSKILINH